jgi:hypothetical protein
MVRAGKLEGDTVLRPQGKTYVVRLPAQVSQSADQVADTDQMPGGMLRGNVAAQEAMAAWSASVLTPILAPIVAELTASRLANEQKAETIGRLTVELDAARAQILTLAASTAPQTPETTRDAAPRVVPPTARESATLRACGVDPPLSALPTPRWRTVAPWLLAIVLVAALAVLGAWPR